MIEIVLEGGHTVIVKFNSWVMMEKGRRCYGEGYLSGVESDEVKLPSRMVSVIANSHKMVLHSRYLLCSLT